MFAEVAHKLALKPPSLSRDGCAYTFFVCVFFFVFVRFLRFLGAFWTDKSLSFRAKTLFLLAPGAFFLAKTLSFVFGQVFDFVFFLFIFVFEFCDFFDR